VRADRRDAEPGDGISLPHASAGAAVAQSASGERREGLSPRPAARHADEGFKVGSARSTLGTNTGTAAVADTRESAGESRLAAREATTADAPALVALASVEGGVGAGPPPDRPDAAGLAAQGSVAMRMGEQDIEALLSRANDLLQSGDVASARLLLEKAADTDDAHAAATAYGSAVVSRLPALMLVLDDAAATSGAPGQPDDAAAPEPNPYAGVPAAGGHAAGSQGWLDYCSAKFRSFDSETGMYRGYSGKRQYCR
jgi:BA14K-like protein